MGSAMQNPANYWKAITAGTEIGPTLTDRNGNRRSIRGLLCTAGGAADLTDQAGNTETGEFIAGAEYALCPRMVESGATATFWALYGD